MALSGRCENSVTGRVVEIEIVETGRVLPEGRPTGVLAEASETPESKW